MSSTKATNPLGTSACFPLYQRGTEGDFCTRSEFKSPLAPLLQRGDSFSVVKGFK
jgi:hypothetical protein